MKKLFIYLAVITIIFTMTSCNRIQNTSGQIDCDSSLPQITDTPFNSTYKITLSTKTVPSSESDNSIVELKAPHYIKSDIIDKVKEIIQKGDDFGSFNSYKTGKELKVKDLSNYTFSPCETEFLDELKRCDKQWQDTHIYLVDIDNDGEDEIAISQFTGGTMGNVYFAILKKDNKSEYTVTQKSDYRNGLIFYLNDTLNIIKFGDTNYLLVKGIDYDEKVFSGISIYCFKNGKYAESAYFNLYADNSYTVKTESNNSFYDDYFKSMNIKDALETTQNGYVKSGTAENKIDNDKYEADIHNDGNKEILKKLYNCTTVYYYPSYLKFEIESGNAEFDKDPLKAITGIQFSEQNKEKFLQQFWCDSYQGKNLINILYRNKIDPVYHLDVYVYEKGSYQKIGGAAATPDKNITVEYMSANML